ncbi:hypothetical protein KR059_000520, partial [Drosophila kikkawai]
MLPLLALLLGLSVLSGLPQDVKGSCSIPTLSPAPLVVTTFGSKSFVNAKASEYEREHGADIELHCGGGFSYKYGRYGDQTRTTSKTKITLRCDSNGWFYSLDEHQDNYLRSIHCLNRVYQMFESRIKLPNCEKDMTLVLGYDFGEIGSLKNAALCYDILEAKQKYFGYTTIPKNRIMETVRAVYIYIFSLPYLIFRLQTQVGQLYQLGLDINVTYNKNLIRSISQSDIDTFMSTEKKVASLFVSNAFQYASLAQDEQQLGGYEDMLGTVWLRVLRSGNWAHWLSAMRMATDAGDDFDVRIGVSGTLQLPVAAVSPSSSMIIELSDGTFLPVPAHIWAHVRALESTGGAGDEFVLIGHNSPFFRSDNSSALCSSMCDQVPWLKGTLFASLHEFPAYGLVQCCRVEDVAQKLDNFPGAYVDVAASTTTVAPVL